MNNGSRIVRAGFPSTRGVLVGAEHAPDVPVVEVVPRAAGSSGAEVMAEAVAAARALASPGGTVLLAPAGASLDQFPNTPPAATRSLQLCSQAVSCRPSMWH